jgi:hypothetical protein
MEGSRKGRRKRKPSGGMKIKKNKESHPGKKQRKKERKKESLETVV